MPITECGHGHLYDTDRYATCPYCNKTSAPGVGRSVTEERHTAPPSQIMGGTAMNQMPNGRSVMNGSKTVAPESIRRKVSDEPKQVKPKKEKVRREEPADRYDDFDDEFHDDFSRPKKERKPRRTYKEEPNEEPNEEKKRPAVEPVKRGTARNIWRSIYPVLIHYVVSIGAMVGAITYFMMGVLERSSGKVQTETILQKVMETSLYQLIVTSILAGAIAFLMYRKDQRKRKEGQLGKGADAVWCPPVVWYAVIVLAVAGCQILNDLLILLKLNELFPGYTQVTQLTMENQPVWLLILTVGMVAPIAEELVFRGLVFRRMKDWLLLR